MTFLSDEESFAEDLAERVRTTGYLATGPGAPIPRVDFRSFPKLARYGADIDFREAEERRVREEWRRRR